MPVEHAVGVEEHLVGGGGNVVRALGVDVGIGHDELLARFEVYEGFAEFFERSEVGAECTAFDVDAFDLVVVLRHADGFEHVVETLLIGNLRLEELRERIVL